MLRMYFDNGTRCKTYRVNDLNAARAIVSGTIHCHSAVAYLENGTFTYERDFGGWIRSDYEF